MVTKDALELTKRENQIMTVLYKRGPSTVAEIADHIDKPPTKTALRTLLRILENRGYVKRSTEGRSNVYKPAVPKRKAAGTALRRVLETFFGGSMTDAVAAYLADPRSPLDGENFERLTRLIHDRKGGER
jgi:predicted transcriptional regulator